MSYISDILAEKNLVPKETRELTDKEIIKKCEELSDFEIEQYYPDFYRCRVCGEIDIDESGMRRVCKACAEDFKCVEDAVACAKNDRRKIEGINGFVADVFSIEEINEILIDYILDAKCEFEGAARKYLEEDEDFYLDYLEKEYGKEK